MDEATQLCAYGAHTEHGVNVVEIRKQAGIWKVQRPSTFNRRPRRHNHDGPPGVGRRAPEHARGLRHAHQQQPPRQPAGQCSQPAPGQPLRPYHSVARGHGQSGRHRPVKCSDKAAATKTLGGSYTPDGPDGYLDNIDGDDYGAPDGLWFQTDQAGDGTGDWVDIGGNVMMCADPSTGQT